MARKPDKSTKGAALRAQADGLVQSSKRDVAAMPITDMQQLAHALQSKQIELARQHEKLRRTHIALQAARDRYKDLYDFSPIAHLTLDTSGTIWEANLSAATLLGPNRQELIGQPLARFVEPEHQAIFQRHCREVVKTGTRHTCEVRLRTETGPFCYVYLESVAMHEEPGPITHWRTALLDISERKQAEEMRAKFAALVEASDDAIIGKDLHGIITSWNQGAQQIFGYTEQEVIGRSISILIPPDHEDEEPYILDQMKRGEPLQHYETVRRRKDGSLIDISLTVSPIRDFEGRVIGGSKIARDITEWKRGQKALSASEARFRSLVSNLPGAVYRCACDPDWTMEFLSDPIEHLCGYPASDFLASRVRSFGSIIHPNDRPMVERVVLGAVSQRRPYAIEYRLLHKDGGIRWVYEKGRGVFAADGQVLWLDGAIFDVTERKISEDALRRSQEFITSVIENLPNMVFVKKADDLTFVRFNKAGEDLLGHSREVLIGKSDYDVFSKEKADYFTKKDRQALETGGLLNIPEEVVETKHQGLRILHTKKIPIYGETGEPQYLLGISEDITDHKQAEESLRKTKEQLQQALLAAKIGLWEWNTDTNEVFFSREWKSQLGYGEEELANTFETWEALLHADDREKATAYVRSYVKNPVGDYEQEFRLRHKDGSYRWIAAVASFVLEPDGRRVRLSGSHKDITDTKRLEAQFLQGQKMEAVGQLAGGVAHDFNNLLTVINGYGALLLDQLPPEDSRHMMAAETVRAGKRAGQLTKQLLVFSRKQVLMLQPLNLNDSLQSIGSMLSRLLGEEVKLAMNLAPDLWSINGTQANSTKSR